MTQPARTFSFVLWNSLLAAVVVMSASAVPAQTFSVIHTFAGGSGGALPYAGVTIDRAGNLYGTTRDQNYGDLRGIAYKMSRSGSGWIFTPVHEFGAYPDGAGPVARVIFGPDGALYGTTLAGGSSYNGTVFRMMPPSTICKSVSCYWNETVLHSFGALPDGQDPGMGDLLFDPSGNIFGTTIYGGSENEEICEGSCGTVYEISPSGGSWAESVIYPLLPVVGYFPVAGVIRDSAGNLYGVTDQNEGGAGTAFELISGGNGQWTENTLLYFVTELARNPWGTLIADSAGNLYGTTVAGGTDSGGTVYELERSGNTWTQSILYNFVNPQNDIGGPQAGLTMDAAGNLYGTTYGDGANNVGSVFKLTYSNGTWNYSSLHDFSCGTDGGYPVSNVTFDSAGNMYGTAALCGANNLGVVWEITP